MGFICPNQLLLASLVLVIGFVFCSVEGRSGSHVESKHHSSRKDRVAVEYDDRESLEGYDDVDYHQVKAEGRKHKSGKHGKRHRQQGRDFMGDLSNAAYDLGNQAYEKVKELAVSAKDALYGAYTYMRDAVGNYIYGIPDSRSGPVPDTLVPEA